MILMRLGSIPAFAAKAWMTKACCAWYCSSVRGSSVWAVDVNRLWQMNPSMQVQLCMSYVPAGEPVLAGHGWMVSG